jgi:hypothetical protein
VDAHLAPCLDLKIIYKDTRSTGYQQGHHHLVFCTTKTSITYIRCMETLEYSYLIGGKKKRDSYVVAVVA